MPQITGSTDVYMILGDPVEQVRAPESFNEIFAHFGLDAVLVPVQVAPADLEAFVRTVFLAPNIKGLWITIPHKTPIMGLLHSCSALSQTAGAVNAVRRNADGQLEGGLFDGEGFKDSLAWFDIPFSGRRVLILGAGGASAAIGVSLAMAPEGPAAEISFYDPSPGRAQELAARIGAASSCRVAAVESNDPAGFDLVINASPLGLKASDPLPCDVTRMAPQAALVDILMKNQPTPLVRAARARGLVAQPGFEMMIQQTHLYLEFMGFHEVAEAVRRDATFIRQRIYPTVMQGEIRPAMPDPVPTP